MVADGPVDCPQYWCICLANPDRCRCQPAQHPGCDSLGRRLCSPDLSRTAAASVKQHVFPFWHDSPDAEYVGPVYFWQRGRTAFWPDVFFRPVSTGRTDGQPAQWLFTDSGFFRNSCTWPDQPGFTAKCERWCIGCSDGSGCFPDGFIIIATSAKTAFPAG